MYNLGTVELKRNRKLLLLFKESALSNIPPKIRRTDPGAVLDVVICVYHVLPPKLCQNKMILGVIPAN